jgi:preprotein translocase subunit SecF
MFIVKKRKIFYIISIVLVLLSILSVSKYGLNFGIDFTGGSVIEVGYSISGDDNADKDDGEKADDMPDVSTIRASLSEIGLGDSIVRQTGDDGYIIRTKNLSEDQRKEVSVALGGEIKRLDTVGPILGKELQGKSIWSIVLVILAIILFITFSFRRVSKPVSSWKYGTVAIVALIHDVIIPLGIFAYLGRAGGYEIDSLFVTAVLVILGFSVHDTIVVFDRTRENLKNMFSDKKTFEEVVGNSLSQTISRSINTTLTTILALLALYIIGPETTKNFSLVLMIGILAGVYSSIFIASPLLVTLQKLKDQK